MIKMFASDLDGTLLNTLHEADGTIRRAIRELTEAGLHVVPATGRSTLPIGEHGFTGLALDACCSNGSIVRDSHGEVLKTWTIDPQITEELLKAFPDICFDCSTPDGMFSSGSFEMHQAGFKKDSPIKRIVMRGMRARGGYHEEQYFDQSIGDILRHDVCKINCRVTSPELECDLKAYLAERSDRVVNAPFDPVMFEKRFRHSYATKNASDAAKAAASATIGSCMVHAVPKHMLATMRKQNSRTVIE